MQRTIRRMEEEIASRVTIPALASAVGLSVTQLNRLFRIETGRTPAAFLHQLRMARALVLVEQTSLPLTAVMQRVGVADRSSFARAFRRAHGLSARTLRVHRNIRTKERSG